MMMNVKVPPSTSEEEPATRSNGSIPLRMMRRSSSLSPDITQLTNSPRGNVMTTPLGKNSSAVRNLSPEIITKVMNKKLWRVGEQTEEPPPPPPPQDVWRHRTPLSAAEKTDDEEDEEKELDDEDKLSTDIDNDGDVDGEDADNRTEAEVDPLTQQQEAGVVDRGEDSDNSFKSCVESMDESSVDDKGEASGSHDDNASASSGRGSNVEVDVDGIEEEEAIPSPPANEQVRDIRNDSYQSITLRNFKLETESVDDDDNASTVARMDDHDELMDESEPAYCTNDMVSRKEFDKLGEIIDEQRSKLTTYRNRLKNLTNRVKVLEEAQKAAGCGTEKSKKTKSTYTPVRVEPEPTEHEVSNRRPSKRKIEETAAKAKGTRQKRKRRKTVQSDHEVLTDAMNAMNQATGSRGDAPVVDETPTSTEEEAQTTPEGGESEISPPPPLPSVLSIPISSVGIAIQVIPPDTPVKRGRGRPRKNGGVTTTTPTTPQPKRKKKKSAKKTGGGQKKKNITQDASPPSAGGGGTGSGGERYRYPCGKCVKAFATVQAKCVHRRSVHEGQRWSCRHCGKRYKYPAGCRNHEITFHSSSGGESDATSTKKNKRSPQEDDTNDFDSLQIGGKICAICSANVDTASGLLRHMKGSHPDYQRVQDLLLGQVVDVYRPSLPSTGSSSSISSLSDTDDSDAGDPIDEMLLD